MSQQRRGDCRRCTPLCRPDSVASNLIISESYLNGNTHNVAHYIKCTPLMQLERTLTLCENSERPPFNCLLNYGIASIATVTTFLRTNVVYRLVFCQLLKTCCNKSGSFAIFIFSVDRKFTNGIFLLSHHKNEFRADRFRPQWNIALKKTCIMYLIRKC